MKTVELDNRGIFRGDLILVNREHPIREDLLDMRLSCTYAKDKRVLLEARTAAVFKHLMSELNCWDKIVPVSSYRSKQEQEIIYADSLRTNGEEFTARYVALPNHSEHQTGLAIDLAENKQDIDFLRPDFPYTGICQAFRHHSAYYGFIERYQKDKESITGIAHEPWHFRYVGSPHAAIMQERKLSLEEYVALIKSHPYGERPLRYELKHRTIEIAYLEASGTDTTCVCVPDDGFYQISGNNSDGFIIAVSRPA